MNNLKHIMILGHVPLPENHPDAARLSRHPGRWVFDQAKAIHDYSDYRVTLVTLVKGASQDYEEARKGFRIIYLKAQSRLRERTGFLWDIRKLRKLIDREQPDLVHAHGTEDAYGLAAMSASIPKVLTVQGLYHDVNRQAPAPFLSSPYVLEKLETICLRHFDHAIVKSDHVAQITRGYFPHLNLSVIPNTLSDVFLETPLVKKSIHKIAFVGAVLPRKGFHHLREALQIMGSKITIELHVFGTSAEREYIESEVHLIQKAGHHVTMHGNVTAPKLLDNLTDCNLLVAPSHAETFGNQVIEAMLCRCHCIVSDETGMSDNVRKYGHGTIVSQQGSSEIAIAIERQLELVKKDASSKNEMRMRGRAREKIIEALGPDKIASQLVDLYQEKFKN